MVTKFVESSFDICFIEFIFIHHRNPINFIIICNDDNINIITIKFTFQIGTTKFCIFRTLEPFCLEFLDHFGFTPIDGNP